MGKHKKMPVKTYHIIYRGDGSSTVICTYICPYCYQDAVANIEAPASVSDRLEQGAFFDSLQCDMCGKVADVRFWQSNKI